MSYRVAMDIGGTFNDFIVIDDDRLMLNGAPGGERRQIRANECFRPELRFSRAARNRGRVLTRPQAVLLSRADVRQLRPCKP